ncbi:DUF6879 family protein [Streptacidiphilus fuscans]|uniref:DUF6879 domain-containing protein n=1 Tax=Streptacidiphilus fuscans TaxID=2789292 RepID=A0A931B8N9_9ACTN|nr:DUF6879 family protein [Streptacidiphilus fuscans]MBF9069848.1 hypothetical protein [Streptacidiphilus fuscans]
MLLAGEEWAAKFRDFKREAWRLETLPQYIVPQEADELAQFRAGARFLEVREDDWTAQIRRHKAEGRAMGRVHVLRRPLSDYLRFEFARYYRHSAQAGEDIRILDVTDRENPLEGFQDFWMFDRSTVVLMNYQADGTQINRVLHEGDVEPFAEAQRIAVAESVPFGEYVTA